MRVLVVHNEYGKYSGEEAVVDRMVAMLGDAGHEVSQLRMTTAGVRDSLRGKVRGFISGLYSPQGVRAMREAIRREKPDVVNVHNLYPFIGPAALRECKRAGVPVVMTVHNYRLICPTGLFMRDGQVCEECLQRGNEWGCVAYNCEQSRLKSLGYAARNYFARRRRDYLDCVDVFACLTEFQRSKLIEAGFPEEKITVIPNSVDVVDEPDFTEGEYVAYSGRLSREKGIDLILEVARRNPGIPFRLAGEVREEALIENLPANVTLCGYLRGEEYRQLLQKAKMVVMASRCYEGFPMSVLEAASSGKPTVAPAHGGFPEIIGRGPHSAGRLFTPGDADDLEAAIKVLWLDKVGLQHAGREAFAKLRSRFSTAEVASQWEELLKSLQNLRK